jgi:hypothetical protein
MTNKFLESYLPYLGLYNAQDFAQILWTDALEG